LSGDDLGINIGGISLIDWNEVAQASRTMGGVIEHIANPRFWDPNEVIVEIYDPEKEKRSQYVISQLNQLFRDINSTVGSLEGETVGLK
jgi:hypothetical protein